ncbi:MAG: 3-keto-disaccharide hydrolase [Planctomycetaceae bacterium]
MRLGSTRAIWLTKLVLSLGLLISTGCDFQGGRKNRAVSSPSTSSEAADSVDQSASAQPPAPPTAPSAPAPPVPPTFEAAAEDLLSQRLSSEEVSQGWVRLFDGYTLFGWEIASAANWRVEDKAILVDSGDQGLLCTSVAWADYELSLEFKSDADTNSGIFLRTPLKPADPNVDCYEVNIAPTDNPFPTGSIVGRQKVSAGKPGSEAAPLDAGKWHHYEMHVVGGEVTLHLDGQEVCKYTDPVPLAAGRIGLQHNQGKVAFRNIKIRPLGMQPLLDKELSKWKKYPDKPGEFVINETGELRVTGGRGQIESQSSYANFAALIEAKTQSEKLNSGVFFRCIEGSEMNGYECQIQNGIVDGNPLTPVDCGTGGIFRRQNARIVAASDREWFSMLLVADGLQIAAWVNGLQVTDWKDTRKPDANPRNGSRTDAGTLMLQAHDPTTDILFRQVKVAELAPDSAAAAE